MECDKCDEELDFQAMKRKNFLKTGRTHLTVFLVIQNTPEIAIRDGVRVRTGKLDLLGIFTEPERAQQVKDIQDSYFEDRVEPSKRPRIHVDEVQINHHWAWCMFHEMLVPKNTNENKIELCSERDWDKEIGDVDVSKGLTDEVIMKLLLKFAAVKKQFYLKDFIELMDVPEDRAKKFTERFLNNNVFRYVDLGKDD
jgi:hypothetical protein